jgi:hypothetical protein
LLPAGENILEAQEHGRLAAEGWLQIEGWFVRDDLNVVVTILMLSRELLIKSLPVI